MVDAATAAEGRSDREIRGWIAQMRTSAQARKTYRDRGMYNLLRMGHCAPAVAQTLLDVTQAEGVWLVSSPLQSRAMNREVSYDAR